MKNNAKQEKYFPFVYKMLAVFLCLLIAVSFSIGVFAYVTSVKYQVDFLDIELEQSGQQVESDIELKLSEVERAVSLVFNSTDVQQGFASSISDLNRLQKYIFDIMPLLSSFDKIILDNIHIVLYAPGDTVYEVYTSRTKNPLDSSMDYSIFSLEEYPEVEEILESLNYTGQTVWYEFPDDELYGNISRIEKLISFESQKDVGYVRVIVNKEELFSKLSVFEDFEGAEIFLIDELKEEVVYSNYGYNYDYVQNTLEDDYIKISTDIDIYNYTMVCLIPKSIISENSRGILNTTLYVVLISIFVASFIAILLSRHFAKKIDKIVSSLQIFRDGDLDTRIEYSTNDELGNVVVAFNEMADEINSLIEEVYIKNIEKQKAELEILQAQINPHFLYNTLSAINSLSGMGKTDLVSEMVNNLVKFYRLSLNKGKINIPIRNEIEHVKAYIAIQEIRYGNRFDIEYDIEESVLDYNTIKVILQPFVENCLLHSWCDESLKITIRVYSCCGDIVFEIEDDGLGIDLAIVENILSSEGNSTGYGVSNVQERIKGNFGENYGIIYETPKIKGTLVKIIIPKTYEKEEI